MRPSHLVVKSLTHGSWSGNIVDRKPPRGAGVLSIKLSWRLLNSSIAKYQNETTFANYKERPPLSRATRSSPLSNVVSDPKTTELSRIAAGCYVLGHTTGLLRGAYEQGSTKMLCQFHSKAVAGHSSTGRRRFAGDELHWHSTGRQSAKKKTS